jgi:hypothetical protein
MKTWTGLCRKSTHPEFDGADRAKSDLDPLLVVPADVRVERLNELLNGGALPVLRIEQLVLEPTEEAFGSCVVRENALRNIERENFASLILDSQPG